MPLFGGNRGDDERRTAAEREAARVERERRRAEREGRPLPASPADEGTGDAPADETAPFERDGPHAAAGEEGPPYEAEHDDAGPDGGDGRHGDVEALSEPVAGRALAPEPSAEADPQPDPQPAEPAAWREPGGNGRAHPRAEAWQQRRPAPAEPPAAWDDRGAAPDAPQASDERELVPRPETPAGAAGAAEAGGGAGDRDAPNGRHAAGDPQATQPFDPIATTEAPRRTVSLPRPQTDTGEWDAPIGTVRVSRGRGRGGGDPTARPYRAQPGAPGYPPYRKLAVKPRRRWLRRFVALLALGLAIAAAAFAFLLFQPKHGGGHGRVVVTVPAGATADQIGDLLAQRGVVQSSFLFSLRVRLSGDRGRLRSGRYTLREGMSYGAALTALTTPPKAVPVIDVTIPEGPSRREEAPKLRAAGLKGSYLAATTRSSKLDPRAYGAPRGTRSLEGFLYPSTYQLRRSDATAGRLVSRQLDAFKANFSRVSMRTARRRNLSRYDVLIIASMIEREALVPRDRRLIAAVIYNRLKAGMPLGIDATLRYALNQWNRPLRVSELKSNSAFNTRKHRGLPPRPIGNPGLPAMRAAANPAHVSYLFYVVKPCGDGAHAFSSTDGQFQRDVARYNAARARRGGKDPSHC